MIWLAAVAGGCGGGPYRGDTFVVEVHGSQQALESFDLYARDMQIDAGLIFSGGLMRILHAHLPWSELKSRTFDLTAKQGTTIVSSIKLKPFLCIQTSDFEKRARSGWRVIETQQAFLEDTGQLELDTDFDHPLYYRCEVSKPTGQNGEGIGTIIHDEPLCSDEERKRTEIRVTGTLAGAQIDATMGTCWAILSDIGAGRISLSLQATTASGVVVLGMTHCLEGPDDMFPVELTATQTEGCPTSTATTVLRAGTERVLVSTSGRWLIGAAGFSKGGYVKGELELTAHGASGDELKIVGPYDLPFLRVPVEGDWHPQ